MECWLKDSFAEVFLREWAATEQNGAVYVESLDGVAEPEHVLTLLKQWEWVPAEQTIPLVENLDPLMRRLADERFFPGYDTIWAVEAGGSKVEAPSFVTWYAAEGPSHLPRSKAGGTVRDWSPVREWMVASRVLFGVSQAQYCLHIRRPDLTNHS